MKSLIKKTLNFIIRKLYPDDILSQVTVNNSQQQRIFNRLIDNIPEDNIFANQNVFNNSIQGDSVQLYYPYKIANSSIGNYTYIAKNSNINNTTIGKFCSIGPNLISGWGIHPTNGLSTSPMFYSTRKQNGMTLSDTDKTEEIKPITIGNDVFIGMNVSVLDGANIGHGAIIGAGSIVSKDIPPYAIAVGNPIKIIRYRFTEDQIQKLLEIKWWNWNYQQLKEVEALFWDIDNFINKFYNK